MRAVFTTFFLSCFLAYANAPSDDDAVAAARKTAIAGDRDGAILMLRKRLAENPGDADARTLYGTVLSWQQKYAEARKQLEQVLAENPGNGDAKQALANVELWTGRPERAAGILAALRRERPNDLDILLAHARALTALKRNDEASDALNRALSLDPGSRDAQRMKRSLEEESLLWEAWVQEFYEWFSDGVGNRLETQGSLQRRTAVGPVIGRFSNAQRFGLSSNQAELEFYPVFRKGTYAYINGGVSPDSDLYPRYRFAFDLYQALGSGFEGTVGYRRLGFASKVNIYTLALSKYAGPWLFTARGYFSANLLGTGQSVQLSARRFLRNPASFWELRYGNGSTPNEIRSAVDIGVVRSNSILAMGTAAISKRWRVAGQFGVGREDRIGRPSVEHYLGNIGVMFQF